MSSTKNPASLAEDNMPESFLGHMPVCDRCGRLITVGDRVIQTFRGRVIAAPSGELGVKEEEYSLVHQDCSNRIRIK